MKQFCSGALLSAVKTVRNSKMGGGGGGGEAKINSVICQEME